MNDWSDLYSRGFWGKLDLSGNKYKPCFMRFLRVCKMGLIQISERLGCVIFKGASLLFERRLYTRLYCTSWWLIKRLRMERLECMERAGNVSGNIYTVLRLSFIKFGPCRVKLKTCNFGCLEIDFGCLEICPRSPDQWT